MIKYENDCVGCDLPCVMGVCSYYRVPHYYCDRCGEETHDLHNFDGEQLCESCLEEIIEEVLGSMSLEEKAQLLDEDFGDVEF